MPKKKNKKKKDSTKKGKSSDLRKKTRAKKKSQTKRRKFSPHLLKGMKDILPAEQRYWEFVLKKSEELVKSYGFQKISTPILEEKALFDRSVGQDTEIVEKQMFTFKDKGGEEVCLRPETTASIARAYIEHGMINLPQPVKLYYYGPQFRYEKPQSGRLRQFHQFGLEVIGDDDPVIDAQVILISYNLLKELGIKPSLQINSLGCQKCRKKYLRALLNYFRPKKRFLCSDCQKRLLKNPLRILDCKNPNCQEVSDEAPQIVDYLCDECREHFIKVLEYLDKLEIPYNLNPKIVRGLDYYSRTIFEIWPEDEEVRSQNALAGGGRYDNLVSLLGGRPAPACGVAFGLERIINKMKKDNLFPPEKKRFDVFLAQIGIAARKECLKIFENLRREKIKVAEAFSKDGLRQQLEIANKLGVRITLILGQKELVEGTIILRDMENGTQEEINIKNVVAAVKRKLKSRVKKRKLL